MPRRSARRSANETGPARLLPDVALSTAALVRKVEAVASKESTPNIAVDVVAPIVGALCLTILLVAADDWLSRGVFAVGALAFLFLAVTNLRSHRARNLR